MLQDLKIEWKMSGDKSVQSITVNGSSELRRHLMDLDSEARTAQHPIVASVVTNDDHVFSIGLGSEEGATLTYDGYKGNPPYFIAAGDESRTGMVNFMFMGSLSELPSSCLLPRELAMRALIDSLERRAPSPMIKWDEC